MTFGKEKVLFYYGFFDVSLFLFADSLFVHKYNSKATFNIKTGEKVESEEKIGFLGGIAKAVLSAQENGPLPVYQLGEKNGNILLSMD